MDFEEDGVGIAHSEGAHRVSTTEEHDDGADTPTAGGRKRKIVEAASFIYSTVTRDSAGGELAIMQSRNSSSALGMLSIAVGMTMPSPLEMATNLGNALKRNDISLSILGLRCDKGGKLSATQREVKRLTMILGTPLERFEAAQAVLSGENVALVNFAAVRSSGLGVCAVHEGGCIGLLERLRNKAQSSDFIHETNFCPLSKSYFGQTQSKSRNFYQRKKVINAFSDLISSLIDAQG